MIGGEEKREIVSEWNRLRRNVGTPIPQPSYNEYTVSSRLAIDFIHLIYKIKFQLD